MGRDTCGSGPKQGSTACGRVAFIPVCCKGLSAQHPLVTSPRESELPEKFCSSDADEIDDCQFRVKLAMTFGRGDDRQEPLSSEEGYALLTVLWLLTLLS